MRLALVLPEWGEVAGGIATYYRHLAPGLQALGHQLQVFVGSASVMDQQAPESYVHYLRSDLFQHFLPRFSHLRPLAGLDAHLAAAWALKQQADEAAGNQPFDLVECCDWGLGFAPWLETSTPLVVRLHASLSQIARAERLPGESVFQTVTGLLEQLGLGWADGLVTYANANAERWTARLGRPVAMIRPPYPLADQGHGGGTAMVSGKIQRWKGVEVLLKALERVPDARVDWYGRDMPTREDGKTISMSRLMGQRYPSSWDSQLKPRGVVPPARLAELRREAPFVVVPSSWDVFNFTVVEAMASAIPVIVSSGAGASELVEHGVNGFCFDAEDPAELADCLRSCMAMSRQQHHNLGGAGRETVRSSLDPAAQARQHAAHYERVARAERRQRPVDLWNSVLEGCSGLTGARDLAHNLSGRALARALVERGARRLGGQR